RYGSARRAKGRELLDRQVWPVEVVIRARIDLDPDVRAARRRRLDELLARLGQRPVVALADQHERGDGARPRHAMAALVAHGGIEADGGTKVAPRELGGSSEAVGAHAEQRDAAALRPADDRDAIRPHE